MAPMMYVRLRPPVVVAFLGTILTIVMVWLGVLVMPCIREYYYLWRLGASPEKAELCEAVGRIGTGRSIPYLLEWVESWQNAEPTNPYWVAAVRITKHRGSTVVPVLVRLLKKDDSAGACLPAMLLAQLGYEARSAIPVLIEVVRENPHFGVKWRALEAIGNCGRHAKEALPDILGFTESPEERLSWVAKESYRKIAADLEQEQCGASP